MLRCIGSFYKVYLHVEYSRDFTFSSPPFSPCIIIQRKMVKNSRLPKCTDIIFTAKKNKLTYLPFYFQSNFLCRIVNESRGYWRPSTYSEWNEGERRINEMLFDAREDHCYHFIYLFLSISFFINTKNHLLSSIPTKIG